MSDELSVEGRRDEEEEDWETGRLGVWETGRLGDWDDEDWETGRLGDWETEEGRNGLVS